jgi:nucleotide-binding universal stress UspA family protein
VPSWERRLVKDQPDEGLARHARFADLAVLSRNDPAGPTSDAVTSLPQYVVLNCARPVLILPCGQPPSSIGTQALIAWNGSMEAALAMTGAIPLLRLARQTTVAVFEPAGDASASSADVQAYLARHGIHAAVQIRRAEGDAGVAILNAARELQCDLMVMGCYGHSKFRELVLGGVSRTILETATVPVLMAH